VTLAVDAFPDRTVQGTVNSIAPAAGQTFALLPPDNATGNFTKIVQRVPVKVTIDADDPLKGRLRPGMSVTATIHLEADSPAPGR
jgi:membrane fusion protein (multidrug efflux system)